MRFSTSAIARFLKDNLVGIFLFTIISGLVGSYLYSWLTLPRLSISAPIPAKHVSIVNQLSIINQPELSRPSAKLSANNVPSATPTSLGASPEAPPTETETAQTPSSSDTPETNATHIDQVGSGEVQKPAESKPDTSAIATPVKNRSIISPPRYGISVALDGLTETETRYIATIRIVNANNSDVGIAMLSTRPSSAEFFLTDSSGGSCQLIANGERWGSLNAVTERSYTAPHLATVPASGEARHFLIFTKHRCDSKLADSTGISLNGTFVTSDRGNLLQLPVSFSDLTMTWKAGN